MSAQLRVLVVDDSDATAGLLVGELRRTAYEVIHERVDTSAAMMRALDEQPWDVVIAAHRLRHFPRLGALSLLRRRDRHAPFIVVTEPADEDDTMAVLQLGAQDYVVRTKLGRLVPVIERALREAEERRVRREVEAALRKSEERYRELVENANDIVLTTDLQGNFTSLNKAGELISGYSREEVVRMNMAQFLTPESLSRAFAMIQQKLSDDRPTVYELEMVARDGHLVPLELSTRLIYHGNTPVGVQGIARDITEQKAAAQALRESEERYRGIFENASDIVYTHDFRGRFIAVNTATERVTGYTRDEVLGLTITDIIAPDHIELAREMIRQKLAEGSPTTYELDIITKDGRRVTLEVNSQLIYHAGTPIGVQGIARDITERRRAEAELRARERKQAVVAELGQSALAEHDLQRVFDDIAECVVHTLELEYCTILESIAGQDLLVSRAGVGWKAGVVGRESVGTGPKSQAGYTLLSSEPVIVEDVSTETRFAIPAVLREHEVSSRVSVVIHGHERPFGVLSAFSRQTRRFSQDDVHFMRSVANVLAAATERKRLEEERAQHDKLLATRVLQAYEDERKRIARELHDETAQSLSVLLTHLDLLEPHIPPDGPLRSGLERIGALARRTLDETRALSHDLRPTILDDAGLVAALEWIGEQYSFTYTGTVRIEAEAEPERGLTPEIELALFRIAQEGLTNAGRHARAREATVRLTFGESEARITVEDDGVGFDPRHTAGPSRGGRLGVYGMRERAALLGGTLDVITAPGKGTRVIATLPLAADDSAAPATAEIAMGTR